MRTLYFFIVMMITPSVFASDWQLVNVGNNFVLVYVDNDSIMTSSGKMKAWTKYIFSEDQETSYQPMKKYKMVQQHDHFNCQEKKVARSRVLLYVSDETPQVVDSITYSTHASDYNEVVPDSVGGTVLEYVCSKNKMKK